MAVSSIPATTFTQTSNGSTPEAASKQLSARDAIRIPRISIDVFHHQPEIAAVFESAARDRLMSGARVTVHAGGIAAARTLYSEAPTPNLIVLESQSDHHAFLIELDSLAEVCDAGTRLMVIGHANDISFYRELVTRGVSEYLLAPVDPITLMVAIASIYHDGPSSKLGQTYGFIGAKGGVGSSTIAHNVAWMLGRDFSSDVILADMDLAFGTASLNLNTDAGQGVADAIQDANRLDHVLLERLLTKYGDHLGLLSAPAALERTYDLELQSIQQLLDVAQSTVPFTILDMPHMWSTWSRGVLTSVDEIVIVSTPDLASLRNTKNLLTILKQARPNDPAPKLVLNQVGVPKRPEIKPTDFSKAVSSDLTACIAFDPQLFGNAANKGQMIAEISQKGEAVKAFADIARSIAGRRSTKQPRFAPGLNAMMRKLLGK